MLGTGDPPNWKWTKLRKIFAPLSALGIVFGLTVFTVEDKYEFYDVDFTGGFKLQARFSQPTSIDDVRRAIRTDTRTVTVTWDDYDENNQLRTFTRDVQAGPYPESEVVAVGAERDAVEITIQKGVVLESSAGEKGLTLEQEGQAFETYVRQALGDRLRPNWLRQPAQPYKAPEDADAALKPLDGGVVLVLTLYDPATTVTPERLEAALRDSMPFYTLEGSKRLRNAPSTVDRQVVVRPEPEANPGLRTFRVWLKSKNKASGLAVETDPARVKDTLAEFLGGGDFRGVLLASGVSETAASDVSLSEPFPSLDIVGASVAQRLKDDALVALILSMLGIIVYVAFRFHSRAMGLSAVLCLFHDVAITLGVVAIANVLGVVDAKINLPMVAAFLTLVGYSVNDTVVVFDRIRENRGKKDVITPEMIDLSVNQTFARSVKTSMTFLLASLALFIFNLGQRNVLEGFSFLLIVGSIVGTYSTVAIAAPLLLFLPWYWERIRAYRPRGTLVSRSAASFATVLLTPLAALLWLAWAVLFGVLAFAVGLVAFVLWAVTVRLVRVEETPAPAPAGA
jgi:preprotein translocase SecF subunit